jgi:hypothetical protein
VLVEAEEDAGSAQGTFDGIQPPDRRAGELRDRLDELLTEATGRLVELRIAARRDELAELPTVCLTPQPAMSLVGSCCAGALWAVFLAAAMSGSTAWGSWMERWTSIPSCAISGLSATPEASQQLHTHR